MPAVKCTRAARFLVALAAVVVAATSPDVGGADRAADLRSRAGELRAESASLARQSHTALLELYALETQLERARGRTSALAARSASVRSKRTLARAELRVARRTLRTAEQQLAERVRALYEEGGVDPLAVVLGAQSFDDALTRLDHLNTIADQDRLIAVQAEQARVRLDRVSRALAAREVELRNLESEAKAAVATLEQTRAERSAYVADLADRRRFSESEIASLEAQAHDAEERAREAAAASPPPDAASSPSAAAPAAPPSTPAPPPSGPAMSGKQMTVVSTAYALPGTTATGIPVGPGVVAVDPAVIPLGTRMTIPGYGEGFAADTGGAIKGARIDVWVPTEAQAEAWGVRTVTITLH